MNEDAIPSISHNEAIIWINDAANDVVLALEPDLPESGVRDAVNLLVNVFGTRLKNPGLSVAEVIEMNYEAGPEEVLSWCLE